MKYILNIISLNKVKVIKIYLLKRTKKNIKENRGSISY